MDLLGGIRKLIGTSQILISSSELSVDNLLSYLEKKYTLQNKIKKNELMIAVNGVESSLLGGGNAKVAAGDVVTILTVVHGG
ncbi:MAG: MoaD/ThiS family protein [Candidatus Nitrosocosmicus sp.]